MRLSHALRPIVVKLCNLTGSMKYVLTKLNTTIVDTLLFTIVIIKGVSASISTPYMMKSTMNAGAMVFINMMHLWVPLSANSAIMVMMIMVTA